MYYFDEKTNQIILKEDKLLNEANQGKKILNEKIKARNEKLKVLEARRLELEQIVNSSKTETA